MNPFRSPYTCRSVVARRGMALVTAIALLTVMSAFVLAFLSTAVESSKVTTQKAEERRLESAADSAIAIGVQSIWAGFESTAGGSVSHHDFRFFMDGRGMGDQSAALVPARTDLLAAVALPLNAADETVVDNVVVEALEAWRLDEANRIRVVLEARVRSQAVKNSTGARHTPRKTVRETFVVEAPLWGGLDYALLANNVNCIMCHTEVDNAERFYGTDPDRYGTYRRVKLGSLESLQLREDPESWIAGTLYLAGHGVESDGSLITDWAGMNFKSRAFDASGHLSQDAFGDLSATALQPANAGLPLALENLYLDYHDDFVDVDGYLPQSFPPPFPDDGGYDYDLGGPVPGAIGNRIVDPAEFAAKTRGAAGTLSGGQIHVVADGDVIDSGEKLNQLTGLATDASLTGVHEGNVYLVGTEENPILLNGDVAVDGDVVMHGVIKGSGSLMVSGNVYVPGDLLYADGVDGSDQRIFGRAADGTTNTLAIAAGGNVMIGDIFTPNFGQEPVTGGTDGSYNFIMEELGLFNRMEWIKTQPTLPGKATKVKVGETTKNVEKWNWEQVEYDVQIDVYERVTETYTVQVPIYSAPDMSIPAEYRPAPVIIGYEEVERTRTVNGDKIGTQTVTRSRWEKVGDPWIEEVTSDVFEWQTPQHANPSYQGESYVPRYYGFTAESEVPIFNKSGHYDPVADAWLSDERAGGWSTHDLTLADPTDSGDPYLFDGDGQPKAIVSILTAPDWIEDEQLADLLGRWTATRDPELPFEVNAMLYSNNSIFGIIPKRGVAGLAGKMILNGGIIAADIGLLAPERFQLNFDARSKNLLDIRSDSHLGIRRELYAPAR